MIKSECELVNVKFCLFVYKDAPVTSVLWATLISFILKCSAVLTFQIYLFHPGEILSLSLDVGTGGVETGNRMFLHFVSWILFFSLGCGIGYGYLHRIPTKPFEEGKKISFPGNSTTDPISPLKDGFTEVRTRMRLSTVTHSLLDISQNFSHASYVNFEISEVLRPLMFTLKAAGLIIFAATQ